MFTIQTLGLGHPSSRKWPSTQEVHQTFFGGDNGLLEENIWSPPPWGPNRGGQDKAGLSSVWTSLLSHL